MISCRTLLLALAAAPVFSVQAQSTKAPARQVRVAILSPGSPPGAVLRKVFMETLRELGWIEGQNIVYDVAYAEGDSTRLPELAKQLVARRPDVISVSNNATAQAAFAATRTIPIVFSTVSEPVEGGLVKSLRQPGGNATGVAPFRGEMGARRMQLLREALPSTRRVGLLFAAAPGAAEERRRIEQAAGTAISIVVAEVKSPADLRGALTTLAEAKAEAVLLTQDALFLHGRRVILELAGKYRIPVIGHYGELATDGALMSYNSSLPDHHRRAAHIVDKVLRGTPPAVIPVEHPTQFELVVNMRTAKTLGITIPQSVLLQTNRVIE